MIRFRASKADIAWHCPYSLIDGPQIEDVDTEPARLGNATHEFLRQFAEQRRPEMQAVAARWDVDRDDLGYLVSRGVSAYDRIRETLRGPVFEVSMTHTDPVPHMDGSITATGTADIIDLPLLDSDDHTIRCYDYKTGRNRKDYWHQLRCYAKLAMEAYPGIGRVEMHVLWLRDDDVETLSATKEDIDEWWVELRRRIYDAARLTPGPHCRYCNARPNCSAHATYVGGELGMDLPVLAADGTLDITQGEKVLALLDRCKAIREFEDDVRARLRRHVQEHGPIDIGEGRVLDTTEITREEIDPQRAWSLVLEAAKGDQGVLAESVKMSKTKLKAAVMRKHDRGSKGAAWGQLMNDLRKAGAVTQKPHGTKLQVRDADDTDEDD